MDATSVNSGRVVFPFCVCLFSRGIGPGWWMHQSVFLQVREVFGGKPWFIKHAFGASKCSHDAFLAVCCLQIEFLQLYIPSTAFVDSQDL